MRNPDWPVMNAERPAVQKVLASFEAGETDILVGTQMLAKGHDYPGLTLVGVLGTDNENLVDFDVTPRRPRGSRPTR